MNKPFVVTDTLALKIGEVQAESILEAEFEAAVLFAPEDLEFPEDVLDWAEENLRVLAGN